MSFNVLQPREKMEKVSQRTVTPVIGCVVEVRVCLSDTSNTEETMDRLSFIGRCQGKTWTAGLLTFYNQEIRPMFICGPTHSTRFALIVLCCFFDLCFFSWFDLWVLQQEQVEWDDLNKLLQHHGFKPVHFSDPAENKDHSGKVHWFKLVSK